MIATPSGPKPAKTSASQSMTAEKLTGFERRVVLRMARGGRLRFQDSGHARLGALNVPASLVGRLSAADLIEMTPHDAGLSSVGAAFALRLRAKDGPGKDERFADQHRDMVTEVREVDEEKVAMRVNRNESPLWWLHARKD